MYPVPPSHQRWKDRSWCRLLSCQYHVRVHLCVQKVSGRTWDGMRMVWGHQLAVPACQTHTDLHPAVAVADARLG